MSPVKVKVWPVLLSATPLIRLERNGMCVCVFACVKYKCVCGAQSDVINGRVKGEPLHIARRPRCHGSLDLSARRFLPVPRDKSNRDLSSRAIGRPGDEQEENPYLLRGESWPFASDVKSLLLLELIFLCGARWGADSRAALGPSPQITKGSHGDATWSSFSGVYLRLQMILPGMEKKLNEDGRRERRNGNTERAAGRQREASRGS